MAHKLINLVALATLAILASFAPTEASALSLESHHFVRHNAPHHALARRAESKPTANRRRCKARPVASSLVASSVRPAPTSSKPAATTPKPSVAPPPPRSSTKAPPPPAPTPAPQTGGERKVGIAWNGHNPDHLANFLRNPRTGLCYTWSPYRCAGITNFPHVQFAAMIWGWKHVEDARRAITNTDYARYILGPNEPDHADQANMSPGDAVNFWRQVMHPYGSRGHLLVAPAPTNGNRGIQWMRDFMAQCQGCKVDFTAVHWYGTDKQQFMDHVQMYRNTFGRRTMVTEFACQNFGGGAQCSPSEIQDFMRTVTNWMDGYEGVRGYFAFGVLDSMGNVNENNRLMDRYSGQPTALGRIYLE